MVWRWDNVVPEILKERGLNLQELNIKTRNKREFSEFVHLILF